MKDLWRVLATICLLIFSLSFTQLSCLAKNATPLAVLKSTTNINSYQDQHLGTYDDDYNLFKNVLNNANLHFDEISENEASGGKASLGKYRAIIIPLCVDVSPETQNGLVEYCRSGGKLIVMDGGGVQSQRAQALSALAGVSVNQQQVFKNRNKLVWTDTPLPMQEDFAVGTMVANLVVTPDTKKLAVWRGADEKSQDTGAAIVKRSQAAYMGWVLGVQGDITANARFLAMTLDELSPGITQEAAVQISFAEYQTIGEELTFLFNRTDEAIKTAKQAEFAVPISQIEESFSKAQEQAKSFHSAYKERRFQEADDHLGKARELYALSFGQAMPVRPVEGRCVWLDRGTIVSTKNAKGMADLIARLKQSGINIIYFETNNAGFTMYPSKLTDQNPETLSWDPLGTACKEAKKHGMEIHAWLWIFNVGNMRHNPIIGKEADYPGPVLSRKPISWAMAYSNGALVPPKQTEFWIDPSNKECRQYIKDLISEVVTKYPIDGIQLDYIRYPFNNKGAEMGFNWLSRQKFEQETGLNLDRFDENTREVFMAWKVHQVSSFVKESRELCNSLKPGLRISAAVYAFPRRMRIGAIQQEWETWVANGWIDTLNPMTYASTAQNLTVMADYCRESTSDKALVYPGLAIMRIDTAGLIEQLDSARATGTLGTTMFAVAHLDDKKLNVLKMGPYRRQTLLTPQSEPLRASRFLFDDFVAMLNRYLQDPRGHILSDTASTNDVLSQIEVIQKTMHALKNSSSASEIDSVNKDIERLHNTVKEWLRLEAFIQRGYRAQYIANYLGQVEAILSYASHKAKVQSSSVVSRQSN